MSIKKLSPTKRLIFIREAIQVVLTDAILSAAMAAKGYTPEQLAVGLSLQESAEALTQTREVNYGSGIEATSIVRKLLETIRGFYSGHRKLAREAFKGQRGQYEKLILVKSIPASREQLIQNVRHFYSQLLGQPELLATLEPYGLTATVAEERLAEIGNLVAAMQDQQVKRAEAEVMTRKRREAMDALDVWSLEFLGVARLVFKGEKEQLKKLGLPIVIRSKADDDEEKKKASGEEGEVEGESGDVVEGDSGDVVEVE